VIVGVAALIVACGPAARAAERPYIGPGDVLVLFCPTPDNPAGGNPLTGETVGGACFRDLPDYVTIRIVDDVVPWTVGGCYQFDDPDVTSGTFCGEITVPGPADAANLTVFVDGALGPQDCADGGSPGIGVRGRVEVTPVGEL
jgi:hypothetical protein